MQNTLKRLRVLDYGLASGSIAWGLYADNPWWLGAGTLGLVLATLNPAARIKAALEKRMLAKRSRLGATSAKATAEAQAERAALEGALPGVVSEEGQGAASEPTAPRPLDYSRTRITRYGPTYISSFVHNKLTQEAFVLNGKPADLI